MRRWRGTWAILLLVLFCGAGALAGCGGGNKGSGEPIAKKQFVDGPPPADAGAGAKLTEAECTRLFEHIVALLEAGLPPDQWEAGKQDLEAERATMIKDCQDGETTRAQYDCLMRATKLSDVPDCVPQGS